MDVTLHKTAAGESTLRAKGEGTGRIEGYASVFNVLDAQGDIVRAGAFAKTLQERVKAGKVGLMVRHFASGGDTADAVGVIDEAKEDERGLFISARLFDSQLAQETRKKVMDSPAMFGLSIGYKIVKSADLRDDEGQLTGKELLELSLYEVTLTMMPANEATNAVAKTADELAQLRERIAGLEKRMEAKAADTAPAAGTGDVPPAAGTGSAAADTRAILARQKRVLALLRVGEQED